MDSPEDDHTFNESGFRGIDETLQRELDTVQAVYFPPEVERYSSSDSEGESSCRECQDGARVGKQRRLDCYHGVTNFWTI